MFEALNYNDLITRKATVYLYSRVSDLKQTKEGKTGIDRQTQSDAVKEVLNKYDEMPKVWMNDKGLSAHHGDNINKGRMGEFIEACAQGEISNGSILIIEYLDRLTRLELTEAMYIANQILKAGVDIFVWGSNEIIRKNDMSGALKLTFELQSANAYTTKLSDRINQAAMRKINLIKEGVRDEDGHCLAVNGYGSNAWWTDTTSGYVKKHPYYWDIACEIIDLNLKGWGWQKIAKLFKEKQYKPPGALSKNKSVAEKAKKTGWNRANLISKLAKEPAALGIKNFKKLNISIKDYYPALLTVEEFLKIQFSRQEKKVSGPKKNAALFSGVGKTRCGYCGSTINTSPNKSNTKYETRIYKCSGIHNPEINCPSGTVNSIYFETAIIKACGILIAQPVKEENEVLEHQLEEQIKEADLTAKNFIEAISTTKNVEMIAKFSKLAEEAEHKKKQLETQLYKLRFVADPDELVIDDIPHDIIDYTNTEVRKKYRKIFFSNIKEIKVKINRNTQNRRNKNLLSFSIELNNGNVFKTALYGNRYMKMPEDQYDEIHNTDLVHAKDENGDVKGALALYANSTNWYGISRYGQKVDFVDFDFDSGITAKDTNEFIDILQLLTLRIENGEKIYVDQT